MPNHLSAQKKEETSYRKEYIATYKPIEFDFPAKKETARIEIFHRESFARKEEDQLPEYFGAFSGVVSAFAFIAFDLFLGSLGISGYYINHDHTFLWLVLGGVIGFLYSYSTYVRKRAIAEHIKSLQATASNAPPCTTKA